MSKLKHLPGTAAVGALVLLGLAGCSPDAPAAPKTGAFAYVTNEGSDDLTIVDVAKQRVTGKIPVGKRPRGIAASPDGRFLYVALSGSPVAGPGVDEATLPPADKAADGVAVVDVATSRILRVLRGISDPEQIAVSPDGARLYVASEDTGQLVVIDPASGGVRARVAVGGEPEGVHASPDGKLVYVTSEEKNELVVVDAAGLKVIARIPVGKRPRSALFAADGRTAYVSGENDATVAAIDVATSKIASVAHLTGKDAKPMGLAVAPDGKALFVTTGRGGLLVRLDTGTMQPTATLAVGKRPWGVALTADGRTLVTANGPSNDVSLVDAATMKLVARLPSTERPWGVTTITKR
ncbi:MAG: cytochrome D1 domain-containing protein [Janthinobacterium lividum]